MKKQKLLFSGLAFIIPFVVYLRTLAPGLFFIDTGELATVCIKLGVAHPTGYPLFTLLGNLFSRIPIGEYIYRLNFMCAFLSSATTYVFFHLLYFILSDLNLIKNDDGKSFFLKTDNTLILNIFSLSGALVLAFSSTFWNTSNSLEVYSLHTLFIVIIIYTFLIAVNNYTKSKGDDDLKHWLIFSFILGLSFTNHLSTIFLSVGFLYLFFAINGFNKLTFRKVIYMAIPFIFALTVYVYFFTRGDHTVISWGYPVNFENFYRHVSGKQFSVWMFSSTDSASKQLSHFISIFPKEFFYFPVAIALIGIISAFIKQRKFFYFTLLLFVFNILYAINYDIHDIDTYFLLAFTVTAIWFTLGLVFLYEKLKFNITILSLVAFAIPALSLYGNYKENDLANNHFVEEYTNNVFKSARTNSIVMSTQWDFWVSASFYYQLVHNVRPDIKVIDKELMRKSWYLIYLKNHYTDVYEKCKSEFDNYEIELKKFERNTDNYTKPKNESDKQDLLKIQSSFAALLNSLVVKNSEKYNFYTTFEIEDDKNEKFAKDFQRIPEGLLFRLSKDNNFDSTYSDPDFIFQKTDSKEYYYTFLMNAYYMMYLNRANYLMNAAQLTLAENNIKKALELVPRDRTSTNMLKKVEEMKSLK